jgi:hypothetical protein
MTSKVTKSLNNTSWEETKMGESKNLDSLRNDLEQKKQKLKQAEHQLQRKQNQLSYREGFSRKERSHRLIVCGAIFEKYFPMIKDLTEPELSDVLSGIDISGFTAELTTGIDRVRKDGEA